METTPRICQSWRIAGKFWTVRELGIGETLSISNSVRDGSGVELTDLDEEDLCEIRELIDVALEARGQRVTAPTTPTSDDEWITHNPKDPTIPAAVKAIRFKDGEEKFGPRAERFLDDAFTQYWDHTYPNKDCHIVAYIPA